MKLHSRIYGWKHVWMEFADEFKASVDDPDPDSSHTEMSIVVPIEGTPWTLVYTMHPGSKGKTDHTTVRAAYTPVGAFKFAIHPENWLNGFGKLMGMQDIVVGHDEFDKAFIVKGSDEQKTKTLYQDSELRELLLSEPGIQIWADCENTDASPSSRVLRDDSNVVSLRVKGAIDDFERMKAVYEIKLRLLEGLCRIDVAKV